MVPKMRRGSPSRSAIAGASVCVGRAFGAYSALEKRRGCAEARRCRGPLRRTQTPRTGSGSGSRPCHARPAYR
jgi:hypothetical protein